jgi:phenylacetic acid degradation operon negative regulatory protein
VQPTPKSLILDLLSTLRRGAFPVGALVAAGGFLGLEGGSVRVALARLLEAGLVEREERGRYRLGARAAAIQGRVVAWRGLEERVRPWAGGWIGVHSAGAARGDRASRQQGARALRFLGFRELSRGLSIRPDNLAGGVDALRTALQELGLSSAVPVFALSGLDAKTEALARALWDVSGLRRSYRRERQALERSEKRLARLAQPQAMAESFVVGGRALRALAFDPLLPESIAPVAERQSLVSAMRRYDRLGKTCWAPFLEEHGVLSPRTPADTRGMTAGAALAAAGGIA